MGHRPYALGSVGRLVAQGNQGTDRLAPGIPRRDEARCAGTERERRRLMQRGKKGVLGLW